MGADEEEVISFEWRTYQLNYFDGWLLLLKIEKR
jgi:hypothetical protein